MVEGDEGGGRCRALIIGVGNEYRRDDGVGVEIARRIDELNLPSVRAIAHSGEGASLLERFGEADLVIIIDATQSQTSPGTISYFDASSGPVPSGFFNYSTHAFSVAEAIEMARALGQLPTRLLVYGIEGSNFAMGVGLSEAVLSAAIEVLEKIKDTLTDTPSSVTS